ncbi:unnamed protein product [Lactuca saligna]|uniref:Asparagine synthetase domain-containing protein n=1 Tax=Lactuca saligna TaxID=75948 RepID=A0AA35ZSZ1_LACSI|nr:unnamed protein product [Lactuca saligna]
MKLDMQRIWKRNLGRDDRCIADNGKEARFPFLDENVIRILLDIPLWEIADLGQPSGVGDKILRKILVNFLQYMNPVFQLLKKSGKTFVLTFTLNSYIVTKEWHVVVRVDYIPSRVDLPSLGHGKYVELVNPFQWK